MAIKKLLKYKYSQAFLSPVKENSGFAHLAPPVPLNNGARTPGQSRGTLAMLKRWN